MYCFLNNYDNIMYVYKLFAVSLNSCNRFVLYSVSNIKVDKRHGWISHLNFIEISSYEIYQSGNTYDNGLF